MLSKQFSKIGGFQPVRVFAPEGCQRVGTPESDFIQILNINGNHWLTISNCGCPKDTAVIYDSLNNSGIESYNNKLLRQISYMLMPRSKQMTLLCADIQKQVGTSDCGLFAIAVATSLCCGVLPQNCKLKQGKMPDHLVNCFSERVLTGFPKSGRTRNHQCYVDSQEVEVYCHCRQPDTGGVFMVQCDGLLGWFRRGCGNSTSTDIVHIFITYFIYYLK